MNSMTDIYLFITGLLIFFMLISLLRLLMGPTAPDRAVALDTINTLVVAAMVSYAIAKGETLYSDVAIVYAFLSYISTLYIAKHLEGE